MVGRPTWTDCDEAGDYVVPNVLSPRDLVFRPDNMDETVPHMSAVVSVMCRENNKGLRTVPCGTPDTTGAQSDLTPFTTTRCYL